MLKIAFEILFYLYFVFSNGYVDSICFFLLFSCSSSFQVAVVKSTDSTDCVSCSTVAGSAIDGVLFCLFFRKFSGIHYVPHFEVWVFLFLAVELLHKKLTLNFDVLSCCYQVDYCTLGE